MQLVICAEANWEAIKRPYDCVVIWSEYLLNANRRTKYGGGLGTRLIFIAVAAVARARAFMHA